jgi:non-homologous end joining protein Ku
VAPRAYWKGYLKLSLVSCPMALYPATSEREKISFHAAQEKKQAGEKIEAPKERKPANVVNLMEALRQSIEAEGGAKGKQPARSVQHRKGGASKPHARQRRAS